MLLSRTRQGQGCTKNPENMDIWEEMLGEAGRHHWKKEPRLKGATVSEEEEDIWQDLQENHGAGDHELNSLNFQ